MNIGRPAHVRGVSFRPLARNPLRAPQRKELPMADPARDQTPDPITKGKLLGSAELIDLAEFAAKRAEKFSATIETLRAGIEARATEAAEALAKADFPRDQQKIAADKARAKARTEIIANSSEARWTEIRQLVAAAEGLALTEALYASPQAVLSRAGLGTPERSDYLKQIAGAGPAEMRQLAALAVATRNTVLGAALQSINDRLPRRDRPISSAELAEALVGEETRAVQSAIARIKTAAQRAINANRELETGRARPLDRVKLALNSKE
jgi:hypothetical protein